MRSWQVGDVRISQIIEVETSSLGGEPSGLVPQARPEAVMALDWLSPHFATPDGWLKFSIGAFLVETPEAAILVDPGIGNDKIRPVPLFDRLKTDFLASLAAAGCPRGKITDVLCTHLHNDHVGWNTILVDGRWLPTFPQARYHMGEREFAHASQSTEPLRQAMMADSVLPVVDAGLADFFAMDDRLFPQLQLIPTPGHSPGHVSVMIESQGESAVISGDVMYHPCQLAHPEWYSLYDADREKAEATRQAFLDRFAGTETLIIGSHFAGAAAGRLVREGDAYRLLA